MDKDGSRASVPATTSSDRRLPEQFKYFLMRCASASTPPANSLASPLHSKKTYIEKRIQELFPTAFPSPDHPPYASMVDTAIKHLNEEGGSSKEAISNYISEEYKHLPWAHAALLDYNLKKLSESSILVENCESNYYMIAKTSINTFKPIPRFTRAISPTLSLSSSHSPSPSASCTSVSTYASSSTSGPGQMYILKQKRRIRKKKNVRTRRGGRGVKCQGKGRGCARGGDRDWDRDSSSSPSVVENTMIQVFVSQLEGKGDTTGVPCMMADDVEATEKNVDVSNQLKGQADKDSVDVESQSEQCSILIGSDPSELHQRVNDKRIELLQLRKAVPEHERRKVKPPLRRHTSQAGRGRGRTRRTTLNMGGTGRNLKPPLATEMGWLTVMEEDEQGTKEQSQLKGNQCHQPSIKIRLIDDANANMVPKWLAYESPPVAKVMGEQEGEYTSKVEQRGWDTLDELVEEGYTELMEEKTVDEADDKSSDEVAASSKRKPKLSVRQK